MRIEVRNGKIVIAGDFENFPHSVRAFFHECYFLNMWVGNPVDGFLTFNGREDTDIKTQYEWLKTLFEYSYKFGIERTEEVESVFKEITEKYFEYRKQEDKILEVQRRREFWEIRQKNGCDLCQYCQKFGDGDFKCLLSGDYLDIRISSVYNYELGIEEMFHESAVPNNHCKDFFKDEIKQREI